MRVNVIDVFIVGFINYSSHPYFFFFHSSSTSSSILLLLLLLPFFFHSSSSSSILLLLLLLLAVAAEELRSLFLKLGLPKSLITPQACDRVVATIDEDGNGEIEFEELSEWVLSNLPPASEHSIAETGLFPTSSFIHSFFSFYVPLRPYEQNDS